MESGRADRKRFAAKLRRLSGLNGKMIQEELHYASGVPLDSVQNYKQEKSLAKGDAMERLAKTLHVSPATFYTVELDNMEVLDEAAQGTGMTQGALADAAGISVFTVRTYEQGKRMPTDEQRFAMAKALGVPDMVLTGYGIRNANKDFNYLLELHHIFGGLASTIDGKPAWRLSDMLRRRKLNKFVGDWNFAHVELKRTGDKDAYQNWKDHYEG